jgi:DNA-binding winged helix-turn-helix (wHTH) protein
VAELFIERPGQPRRRFGLEKDEVWLGKRNDCDVLLDSPFVSRAHARIELMDGRYAIVDTGSLNGVTLNGGRIETGKRYELSSGDQISIAEFTLTFWEVLDQEQTVRWRGPAPGTLFVDEAAHKVWVGDVEIQTLQPIPFKLLAYLYANRGRVCSKQEIGDHVWGAVDVGGKSVPQYDDTALQQAIHRVRQKIEPPGRKWRFLHNVRPSGYRLEVTSAEVDSPGAEA